MKHRAPTRGTQDPKTHSSSTGPFVVAAVLVLAAIVRLWGLQHDLPTSYYQDEMHFIHRALSFGSGDLNPHWFHKPAFYMYVLFFEYGLFFLSGYACNYFGSVDEFAVSFVRNPGPFVLIGRLTTFSFSLASVLAVYRIGERHLGTYAGVAGAVLLALTYGDVEASRVVKADVPSACFCIWSAYFLLNYLQDRRLRSLLVASSLAGLSAATKYYGLAMLLPIGLSTMLVSDESARLWSNLVLRGRVAMFVAIVFVSTFFVSAPFNFLDARGREETLSPIVKLVERTVGVSSTENENKTADAGFFTARESTLGGTWDYGAVLVGNEGMGLPIGLLSLMGVCLLAITNDLRRRILLVFPLALAVMSIVSYPGYAEPRHQVPLYPFLAVGGGALLVRLVHRFPRRLGVVVVGLLLLSAVPLRHLVARSAELSKEDTRNVAKQWIEQHITSGSRMILSENGPPLLCSPDTLAERITVAEAADPGGQFTAHYAAYLKYQSRAAETSVHYALFVVRLPWWRESFEESGTHTLDSEYDRDMANPLKPVGIESYDKFRTLGFEYAVVHSDQYESLVHCDDEAAEKRFPAYTEFYQQLMRRGTLLEEFAPGVDYHGPTVRIYRLSDVAETALGQRGV